MTLNTTPLISIGITCYNAEDTIERAISSALNQNWPNFEVIIVDDYSIDESFNILSRFCDNYPDKIRMSRNPKNSGAPVSRNNLLDMAKGKFIVFFDDDDESLPARITQQYQAIKAYEHHAGTDKICCFSSICKKYANGYQVHFPAIGSKPETPSGDDMVRYQLYLERDPDVFYGGGTPSCSLMSSVDLLRKAGGFDPAMKRNEDSELSIRLGQMGVHFIGIKEESVIQYASDGIDKRPEVGYESEMILIDKYRPILEASKRYRFARNWIKMRYYHYSQQRGRAIAILCLMLLQNPVITAKRFFKAAPKRLLHEKKMA